MGSFGAAPTPKQQHGWRDELQVMGGKPKPSDGRKDRQLLPSPLLGGTCCISWSLARQMGLMVQP